LILDININKETFTNFEFWLPAHYS